MTADDWSVHPAARYGAGADHHAAWIAAGSPAADRSALSVVGDRRIVDAVRDVVEKLPEAAAWFLVGNAMIVCTGRGTKGWCGELPVPPCATPALVAIAVDDPGVIAHELAHAWHRRPLPAACRLTAEQLDRLRVGVAELAVDDGTIDELLADRFRGEEMADALGSLWGFPIDSTSGCAGERRRRRMLADITRDASTTITLPGHNGRPPMHHEHEQPAAVPPPDDVPHPAESIAADEERMSGDRTDASDIRTSGDRTAGYPTP